MAALREKVISSMLSGAIPDSSKYTARAHIVRVLPDPAPAMTKSAASRFAKATFSWSALRAGLLGFCWIMWTLVDCGPGHEAPFLNAVSDLPWDEIKYLRMSSFESWTWLRLVMHVWNCRESKRVQSHMQVFMVRTKLVGLYSWFWGGFCLLWRKMPLREKIRRSFIAS